MINKKQLKSDGYPIECWFNVYSDHQGLKYTKREYCEYSAAMLRLKPLYRIHVRLK